MKSPDINIAVIGPMNLQNQLLAFFIQEKTGADCFLCEKATNAFIENCFGANALRLILFDCFRMDKVAILDFLGSRLKRELALNYSVLFNLGSCVGIEEEALNHGVRGFLYEHECADTLFKAIEAVLAGEVWISRKRFTEWLLAKPSSTSRRLPDLTKREVEILTCLAKAYSNQMIGDKLCISPHTVKTHMANIFKKINVRNRRHAAQWATKNL